MSHSYSMNTNDVCYIGMFVYFSVALFAHSSHASNPIKLLREGKKGGKLK